MKSSAGFALAAVVMAGVERTATAPMAAAARARFFFSMVILLSLVVVLRDRQMVLMVREPPS